MEIAFGRNERRALQNAQTHARVLAVLPQNNDSMTHATAVMRARAANVCFAVFTAGDRTSLAHTWCWTSTCCSTAVSPLALLAGMGGGRGLNSVDLAGSHRHLLSIRTCSVSTGDGSFCRATTETSHGHLLQASAVRLPALLSCRIHLFWQRWDRPKTRMGSRTEEGATRSPRHGRQGVGAGSAVHGLSPKSDLPKCSLTNF
jgi:hypothetical protein